VFLYDRLNVRRAGTKRQVWMRRIVTRTHEPRTSEDSALALLSSQQPSDTLYQVLINCATYQFRIAPSDSAGHDYPWDDIALDETNMWRRVAKAVCPKAASQ
jgi:hypothetical protein